MTLAWVNKQESTPEVEALFSEVDRRQMWVPGLWWIEVANALQMAVRRQRITRSARDEYLQQLQLLPVRTDARIEELAWSSALALSDRHSLTVYDAVYLELALRRTLPLATLDRALRTAANAEGVALLGA